MTWIGDGWTHGQIADALGIDLGAAKMRVRRVRQRMKETLVA